MCNFTGLKLNNNAEQNTLAAANVNTSKENGGIDMVQNTQITNVYAEAGTIGEITSPTDMVYGDLTQTALMEALILALSMDMMDEGWSNGEKNFQKEFYKRMEDKFTLNPENAGTCYPSGASKERTLIAGTASSLRKRSMLDGYEITEKGKAYLGELLKRIRFNDCVMNGTYATITAEGAGLLARIAAKFFGIDDLIPEDEEAYDYEDWDDDEDFFEEDDEEQAS